MTDPRKLNRGVRVRVAADFITGPFRGAGEVREVFACDGFTSYAVALEGRHPRTVYLELHEITRVLPPKRRRKGSAGRPAKCEVTDNG